ncbi:1-acyl-sn-glycerol-3-phosphate acyltransferase [Brachybacterium sp. EF45031]|nr:1-acyl-sn-glycerol-3-phosphate acyltransferase [Brachybacterium sillae]
MRALWAPRIEGLDHVPRHGAFLLVSNHLANVDSFLLPVVMPRQVRFIAKDVYWHKNGPVGLIQRAFFDAVGTVPVDRAALASGRGALDVALGILRQGDGFGIYPEGTRSKDGRLHAGKPGAAWLAQQAQCPVIPVGLSGTPELFAKGRWWRSRGVVRVRIGAPIDFTDLAPDLPEGVRRRRMTERIMDEIAALSGQERA